MRDTRRTMPTDAQESARDAPGRTDTSDGPMDDELTADVTAQDVGNPATNGAGGGPDNGTNGHTGVQRRNTAGLTPWKPGQSGNPRGRPKGRSLTDRLRDAMTLTTDFDGNPLPNGRTRADLVVDGLMASAAAGNAAALTLVLERLDGKLTIPIALRPEQLSDDELISRAHELLGIDSPVDVGE
jgi:hypothetical protein